jgi:hypothetical protein
MKCSAFILLLIVSSFSCSKKEKRTDLLSQNEMEEIVWDLMRADQYASGFLLKDSAHNKKDESVKLYEEIFYIHKITREQFKRSFDYYTSRPDLFRPIIDSLSKRKISTQPFPVHPISRDSLVKRGFKDSLRRPAFRKRIQSN